MSDCTSDCVIVFLRAPDRGYVKTRLARKLGHQAATDLYRCFVEDLLGMLGSTGYPVRLCYTPPDAAARLASWLGPAYPMMPQKGADLGDRMADAFLRVFSGGVERALLVGTDVPDLPAERIFSGFAALRHFPAVLGPVKDGGYCLIGFRADGFSTDVFAGLPWGSEGVLQQTLGAFSRRGQTPRLLESWQDIDTLEDLAAFWKRVGKTAAAPATTTYLASRFVRPMPGKRPESALKFD
ncbi:MAG: TIGR04282 family arsenosugar biosynthesis glycosyltransferase [Desulfobacterales bacterium]